MSDKIRAMNRILDADGNVISCRAINYTTGEYSIVRKEDWASAGFENAVIVPNGEVQVEFRGVDLDENLEISDTLSDVLYHGTPQPIVGAISTTMTKGLADFGVGFYVGNNIEYSKQMAYGHKYTSNATIYTYAFDSSAVPMYVFKDLVLWALYVGYNRGELNIDLKEYPRLMENFAFINSREVVVGLIADDRVSTVFKDFHRGVVTFGGVVEALRYVKNGYQYVFKTPQSVNSLTPINTTTLSAAEAKEVRHQHDVETGHLVQQIEDITVAWRRTGKYKDELLEEWR